MSDHLISFDSENHHYNIIDGMLEINSIYIFDTSGIKFMLTPHTEGEDLLPSEILLKEHKNSNVPYRLTAFQLKDIKTVSSFNCEDTNNQYTIDMRNLFIYCPIYTQKSEHDKKIFDKVEKDSNNKVISVGRRKYLELPIPYIKGARIVSKMYLPTSSFKVYKTPQELNIEAHSIINNFKYMHKDHPERDTEINLLFSNPCIKIKVEEYEEEL